MYQKVTLLLVNILREVLIVSVTRELIIKNFLISSSILAWFLYANLLASNDSTIRFNQKPFVFVDT